MRLPVILLPIMKDRYLKWLIEAFEQNAGSAKAELYMYGSRVKGTENRGSDIDLAVKSVELSPAALSRIRESLHESHIPFKIDLVELSKVNEAFRKEIEKDGILIWRN